MPDSPPDIAFLRRVVGDEGLDRNLERFRRSGFALPAGPSQYRPVMKAAVPLLTRALAPWLLLAAFVLFPFLTAVGVAHA
jgi:hypothetical protein